MKIISYMITLFAAMLLPALEGAAQSPSFGLPADSLAIREARFMKQQLLLDDSVLHMVKSELIQHFRAIEKLKSVKDTAIRKAALTNTRNDYLAALHRILSVQQYTLYLKIMADKKKDRELYMKMGKERSARN